MFTIGDQQFATLRKHSVANGLVRTFEGSPYLASLEATTGDVLVKDPRGHTTRVSFDQQGFVGGVTSPLGRRWRLDNDPQGKLLGVTNPAGFRLGVEYGALGEVSRLTRQSGDFFSFGYGTDGQLTKVVHPDQTTTLLKYLTKGELTAFTNRLGNTEAYEYDPAGNLSAIQDCNGNRTRYRYSVWNRPDCLEYPDGSRELYEYSPWGFVRRITTGSENAAEIKNDGKGRPLEIQYSDGELLSFVRDGDGRVLEARNHEIALKYRYDEAGRVLEEDQAGTVIKYQYDAVGTLTGIAYPTGETVEFGYDADLRLTSVKDWNDGAHNFVYSRDDRGFTHHLPNGLTTTVRQTETGLPLSIAVSNHHSSSAELPSSSKVGPGGAELPSSSRRGLGGGEPSSLFSLEYQYDAEDRVHAFTDSEFGSRQYFYDPEGQLVGVKASDSEKNEEFAYDPAGNRVRATGAEATFNSLNQLVNQGSIRCGYDAAGNLVFLSRSSGAWHYSYNARNLLVRAEGPEGEVVTFGYDAFGRRIWKRNHHEEVRFIWAGEQMVREIVKDENGSVHTRDYLYFPGTYTPLAVRVDGKVYYYHTDHLATPRRLTDAEGQVVWAADYSAFGRIQTRVNTVWQSLRFPGQYFDPETGLHYNRFRYYSPLLGRYLTRDPASYLAGLNVYWYVVNNPVSSADPIGLWGWRAVVSVAAGLGAAAVPVILATAPVSIPLLAAAAVLGVGVAVGVDKLLNLKDFCVMCALKGFEIGFLEGAGFAALVGAVMLGLPALATVIAVGASGVAIYSMLQEHKSYFDMTAEQQSASIGQLTGAFAGAAAVGFVANRFVFPRFANAKAARGGPRPSPKFQPPTNPPQLPPDDIPPGWRIRQMPPTEQYRNGYWKLEKPMKDGSWQPIDPSTMKPGGRPQTHVPLPPPGGK
jgi:RHS repeat-associated protein